MNYGNAKRVFLLKKKTRLICNIYIASITYEDKGSVGEKNNIISIAI